MKYTGFEEAMEAVCRKYKRFARETGEPVRTSVELIDRERAEDCKNKPETRKEQEK